MLNTEIFIKRNILYIRFNGELDQKNVDGLRFKVVELIDKYHIKYLVFNFKKFTLCTWINLAFMLYWMGKLRKDLTWTWI